MTSMKSIGNIDPTDPFNMETSKALEKFRNATTTHNLPGQTKDGPDTPRDIVKEELARLETLGEYLDPQKWAEIEQKLAEEQRRNNPLPEGHEEKALMLVYFGEWKRAAHIGKRPVIKRQPACEKAAAMGNAKR
jgi:hypothetical protein